MRRLVSAFAISALLMIGHASAARAADASSAAETPVSRCPICGRANNESTPYPEKAAVTFVRGATNTVFGWTELLMQPAAEAERSGNLAIGMGKGVQHAVSRTASGLGELCTFWVPKHGEAARPLVRDCPLCMRPMSAQQPKAARDATTRPADTRSAAAAH